MIRRLEIAVATGAFVLGCLHICIAFWIYKSFSIDALWFVGTGLAMTTTALSNFTNQKSSPGRPLARIIQNSMMVAFFAAALFVLPAPQVGIGFVLFTVLLIFSLIKPSAEQTDR